MVFVPRVNIYGHLFVFLSWFLLKMFSTLYALSSGFIFTQFSRIDVISMRAMEMRTGVISGSLNPRSSHCDPHSMRTAVQITTMYANLCHNPFRIFSLLI